MGVKFKDKNTGFIAEFEYEVDIETTRKHPDYEEIVENKVEETVAPKRKYTTSK